MSLHNIYKTLCDGLGLAPVQGSYVQALGDYFSVVDTVGINYADEVLVQALINSGGPGTAEVLIENTLGDFPFTGDEDTLYVTKDTNIMYRWDTVTNTYVVLNDPEVVNPDAPEEGRVFFADYATTDALAASTYSNGTSGVTATITGDVNGIVGQVNSPGVIDSEVMVAGKKLLIQDQTPALENGIYEITTLGDGSNPFVLTRIAGYDATDEIYPSSVSITDGTLNLNKYFTQNIVDPIIGTDSITYGISTQSTPVTPVIYIVGVIPLTLPTITYADGPLTNIPAFHATLTSNVNGIFPSISSVTPQQNMRLILNGQTNAAHNGDYVITDLGSATSPYVLRRVGHTDSTLSFNVRSWVVNHPDSTNYGERWSLSNTAALVNTQIGTTNLSFEKTNILSNILSNSGNVVNDLQTIVSEDGFSEWMMDSSGETWIYRGQDGAGDAKLGLYTDDHFFGMVDSTDPNANGVTMTSGGFINTRLGFPTVIPGPGDMQFENNTGNIIISSTDATSNIQLNTVSGVVNIGALPTFADEAAASGLTTGDLYNSADGIMRRKQ